jgi:Zn-dependent protease
MEISIVDIIEVTATVIALMIAIIGHEIMHGKVAFSYGDATAKNAGRLSINPIKHIDLVGSIIIPISLILLSSPFVIGWAKPVPVNINTVLNNRGYIGAINVSLAGVFYNIILAVIGAIILTSMEKPTDLVSAFVYYFLLQTVILNVILAVFNLWPVPSFDGGNFLVYTTLMLGIKKVYEFYQKLEPFSLIILVIILLTPLQKFLFAPAFWIWELLLLN